VTSEEKKQATPHEEQLDSLLKEPYEQVMVRENSLGAELRRSLGGAPVLFGCGALGRIALAGLRGAGVEPLAFADNHPLRWGTALDGLPVLSLAEAIDRFGDRVPVVVTIYTGAEVEGKLRRLGLRVLTFPQLALMHPQALLPWLALDLPSRMCDQAARVRQAFSLWADEESRREYVAQVHFRSTLAGPLPAHLPAEQTYFPSELVELKRDEVFVDCGAFDGDSVLALLRRTGGWVGGVVAIEADAQNGAKLREQMSRLPKAVATKIEIVQAAVGAENGTLRFRSTGTVTSTAAEGQGTVEVPRRRLDDLLNKRNATYIKMDIEGAEPSALEGCRLVIEQHAPVLAICLYHRQSDLWEIPLQIRAMTDRYQFFLRRYSDDCWEQILYAIPKDRVRR